MEVESKCEQLRATETLDYRQINRSATIFFEHSNERMELNRKLLQLIAPKRSDRILEVGCGEGHLLEALARRGSNCVGVDPDSNMVSAAKHRLSKFPNARVVPLKFEDFDEVVRFDTVITSHTFSFFGDKLATLKKLLTYAREGGKVIIVAHSAYSEQIRILHQFSRTWRGVAIPHIAAEAILECLQSLGYSASMELVRTRANFSSPAIVQKLGYFLLRVPSEGWNAAVVKVVESILGQAKTLGRVRIETTHGIVIVRV